MEYRKRAIERLLGEVLATLPGALIVGPRAVGKSTTASRLAASMVRLDRPAEAAAFRADPDAALRGLEEPVLLDEWQAVPDVLGAVKRAVDEDPHPGRYLLTGSVRAEVEAETWPGTGRLIRIPMYGMTIAEQRGQAATRPIVDRLTAGVDLEVPADPPDLRGYVELAMGSGYPPAALAASPATSSRWLGGYVDQLVTRDAIELERRRDPAQLRRYLEAYALNTAGIPTDKSLYEAAGVNRKTAGAYERLLTNLMVVEATPAWTVNRLKRLVLSPKRHLVDSGLLAPAARLDEGAIMREGDLLGRLLDTFVVSQIRAELPLAETRPRLYHLREKEGRHEVDLIAELGAQRVVAIEVKADAGPGPSSVRHLEWLRDRMGERFTGGVVFHSGPRVYKLSERIVAAPICTIWA